MTFQPQRQVFMWEPNISPHKIPLSNAIAQRNTDFGCTYIFHNNLTSQRIQEGWEISLDGSTQLIEAPSKEEIVRIVRESHKHSIHIFSGIRWVETIVNGLNAVQKHGRRFGIMSEPRASLGLAGWGRFVHSWISEHQLRRNCDFILGIGAHGPKWFSRVGYPDERIFPFAYYSLTPKPAPIMRKTDPVVCFLGRLEATKGFHLFLESLTKLTQFVDVRVAGTGSLSPYIYDQAVRSNGKISYFGALKMSDVPNFLEKADILVLPSTDKDGWGAVVAEALQAGCFVIVSPLVGASLCLAERWRGTILSDLSSHAIIRECAVALESNYTSQYFREQRHQWAEKTLSAKAGSNWLHNIFDHIYDGTEIPQSPFI